MSEEKLTHWRKNNDPKYISGEDLKMGMEIGKGLKPEMVVEIAKFEDKETFDQNNNSKVLKTGFWLKEVGGKMLYKPVILNNTNAAFCVKEFQSDFMEHWMNKPFVVYAKADTRHGHVVRFKKHFAKSTVSPVNALAKLAEAKTLEELGTIWAGLKKEERTLPTVLAKKDELKTKLK